MLHPVIPSFSSFFPLLLSILLVKHTLLHLSFFRSYSFQSFFSCVLISLSSTFYPSPLSFFACQSSTFSFCFSCLCSTFFITAFYLSPLTFFVYHLIVLSASISSFFAFYCPSWLSSAFILCLSSIIYSPYSSLYPFARLYVFIIIIIIIIIIITIFILLFFFPVFSSFQSFVCLFC